MVDRRINSCMQVLVRDPRLDTLELNTDIERRYPTGAKV